MRRTLLALSVLLPACGDSSEEDVDVLAGIERHPAPPAGQSGATLTYENGHPLDWITDDAGTLSYEDQVVVLVNQHRASMGLVPLVKDEGLRRCARGHSRHMRGDVHAFVAHVNPEGHGPADRALFCGVMATRVAENAAGGPGSPFNVFNGWIASPGHRANIEEPAWRRTGVGYQAGPPGDVYGHYWTQLFAN
ncbi:MAG TPA: CAP domain-containing protein [Planctomycetota bacterium]